MPTLQTFSPLASQLLHIYGETKLATSLIHDLVLVFFWLFALVLLAS